MKWTLSVILFSAMPIVNPTSTNTPIPSNLVVAEFVASPVSLDSRHPSAEWQRAAPISFCSDWQGRQSDPSRKTTVRVLWDRETIYLHFDCSYRELFVFPDSDPSGRRDKLWDRDVAEVFLQPDPSVGHYYKEFEVSPNGMWIDLDISPQGLADLKSGMRRSVWLDEGAHMWSAELAIPIRSITPHFSPTVEWRINLFRIEGKTEPRFYSAWQPTNTPQPNFHVPSAFGYLNFHS